MKIFKRYEIKNVFVQFLPFNENWKSENKFWKSSAMNQQVLLILLVLYVLKIMGKIFNRYFGKDFFKLRKKWTLSCTIFFLEFPNLALDKAFLFMFLLEFPLQPVLNDIRWILISGKMKPSMFYLIYCPLNQDFL